MDLPWNSLIKHRKNLFPLQRKEKRKGIVHHLDSQ
ncbi:hypothetical protein X975_25111, partial [Stegodyphus mimosarum]